MDTEKGKLPFRQITYSDSLKIFLQEFATIKYTESSQ